MVPAIRFLGFEEGWEEGEVNTLLRQRNTQAPKSTDHPLMAFISGVGVTAKGQRYNRASLVNDEISKKYKQTEYGDFIYSSNNLETGSIGLNRYGSASISPVYSVFQPTKNVEPNFIGRLFVRKEFINEMLRWRQGVVYGQWKIHEENFLQIEVQFPKIEEQIKIGEYFQQLDTLIEGHRRKLKKLLQLRSSLLEKMFPKQGQDKPEIRFAGFDGNWSEKKLGDFSSKITDKNDQLGYSETFTNSAKFGIISQTSFFDNEISNPANIGGYYIVEENDFVYNPRISNFAPCGPINRNKLGRSGVMSPLYTVFRANKMDFTYMEYYFKSNHWHKFMFLEGDTGARSDRFAIKSDDFFNMPIPAPPTSNEQKKIGQLFKHTDSLIDQHQTQINKLLNIKQACMKKMFV